MISLDDLIAQLQEKRNQLGNVPVSVQVDAHGQLAVATLCHVSQVEWEFVGDDAVVVLELASEFAIVREDGSVEPMPAD